MWKYIFEIGVNLFDYTMFTILPQNFFKQQQLSNKKYAGMLLGFAVIMSCINVEFTNASVNILCSVMVVCMIAMTYQKGIKLSIFMSGLYAVISLFAEFIASLLVIWLKTVPDLLVHAYSGNYMMAVIISKLLLFMMIFLLVSRKKDYEIQLLPQVFHSILFTIPIFSCVILLCNMDSYYFVYSDKVAIKIIGLLSLLYINVIVFFIFNKCNEMAAKIMESRLISQEIAYKDAYYRTVEKNQMELREVRHNLKNQLLGIKHVLQQSGDENASKILEELGNFETKIYSENPVIHSIVECKLQEAKKAGIEDIKVDIRVPKQVQISCGDLGIVIGNLLDNAIEGNQELEKKERALDIEMCYLQKNFLLKIENPISQKQKQAYQKGKTRKLDKINHGIGLKSVEKILKSYNSHMEIECNDTFCVNIMFMNV